MRRAWGAALAAAVLASCAPGDVGPVVDPSSLPAPVIDVASPPPAPETAGGADGYAPVVAEPAPVVVSEPEPPAGGGNGRIRAGVLTAGDIDDTLNLGAFASFLAGAREATGLPMLDLSGPVLARLVGPDGTPLAHQRVTLRRAGDAEPFWDGYSGTGGLVTVFPAALGAGHPPEVELRAFGSQGGEPVVQRLTPGTRADVAVPFAPATPDFLDLTLVVDVTGSMGDELEWLTEDLDDVLAGATRGLGLDVRTSLIVYRDEGDAFTVRGWNFTPGTGTTRALLAQQSASGGGDWPEAVADAMAASLSLPWRRGLGERLLVHVADAPPHDPDARRFLELAAEAADRGIQIIGLGASGADDESEMLMRQAAAVTQGRYLFLTDDSGVGNAHDEPVTSCYVVTELRSSLIRAIRSELTGQRIEPASRDVVRQVGSYDNGVCQD
jgi:hypothetical protein